MITIIITVVTVLVSIACFGNKGLFNRLSFIPAEIKSKNQFERFITHAFVHADWIHLIVNMLVFFSFGGFVESRLKFMAANGEIFSGTAVYLVLYFGGAVIASLSSYFKQKDNPYYISVGASGAVSAVLFTSIFYSPMDKILFYGVIPMPGIIFGVLYLVYSSYMSKKSKDNINHDAHFWGAVYGLILPVILDPNSLGEFINHIFG